MNPAGPTTFPVHGELHSVRERIWMIPLTLHDAQPKHTLAYVVQDDADDLHLIDPGYDLPKNRALLTKALAPLGGLRRVRSITATHAHADHIGIGRWLSGHTGAPIALPRGESDQHAVDGKRELDRQRRRNAEWAVPAEQHRELLQAARQAHGAVIPVPDVLIADGDLLPAAGRRIRVVETPGHTAGHACFLAPDDHLVFTGDLVLPRINPGFGLGGDAADPLGDFLSSLERISAYDGYEACPGHEHRFAGVEKRCRQIAAHHLRRSAQITDLIRTGRTSVWDIASGLAWRIPFERMHGGYLRSALLQVSMHVDHLRAGPRT